MITQLLNARVFAPKPLGLRHLTLCGSRVIAVSTEVEELPASLVSETLDLEGRTVIPGLIDCHAHFTGGGGEAGFISRVPRLEPSDFTAAGITSAVGLLGTDDLTRTMLDLLATTRALAEGGLNAWCWAGGYHLPPATLTGSVRSDIVLIDRVIGVGELALSDHRSSQPTLAELLRVASEAHVAGMMAGKAGIVHLHMGDGPRGLDLVRRALRESELPRRVFHPTHVNRRRALFEEALELAGSGSTIDVTAFPTEAAGDASVGAGDDDELSAVEAIESFWAAGISHERLTVSSDGGGCLPTFDDDGRIVQFDVGRPATLFQTLRDLLGREHPIQQAVAPFTANVADLLRLPGKGRIGVGTDADLVVIDDEHRVVHVMACGAWHVRDGVQVHRDRFS